MFFVLTLFMVEKHIIIGIVISEKSLIKWQIAKHIVLHDLTVSNDDWIYGLIAFGYISSK
jgi:hypothetical protein